MDLTQLANLGEFIGGVAVLETLWRQTTHRSRPIAIHAVLFCAIIVAGCAGPSPKSPQPDPYEATNLAMTPVGVL